MERPEKNKGFAFVFWCLGLAGVCGIHRLYVGKYLSGAIWFFTLGLLFIGQLIDLFYISDMVDRANGELVPEGRRRRRPPRLPGRDRPSKRCPECAERIQAGARSCRFCGTDLTLARDPSGDDYTICSCPECDDILEVPNHLLGVPGKCQHCGQNVTPVPPGVARREV